jgi:putative sterol carrier protein
LQELGSTLHIGITQVVSDGPEDTVIYHLQVGDGVVSFGPGPADPEDVRLEQEWDTAVAVATGDMTAEDAFITGSIRLGGNAQLLLESQQVFAALDPVFSAVAAQTQYD